MYVAHACHSISHPLPPLPPLLPLLPLPLLTLQFFPRCIPMRLVHSFTSLTVLVLFAIFLSACASRTSPKSPNSPQSTSIGLSRQNRPITATTFGTGHTRIYLIGSIHGDEPESRYPLQQIITSLQSTTHGTSVRLIHDMNPDGSQAGTRTNFAGVDLNRNWPAKNFTPATTRGPAPLSEPESAAVHRDIQTFHPHLIVVLHSARRGPFMNYDGPPAAQVLSETFVRAAKDAGDPRWRVVPDMGYPTPGSLGSYFGHDRSIPILTVEFRRGDQAHDIVIPFMAGLLAVVSHSDSALDP